MCLMVYVASDKSLPLIEWDEHKRAFCVSDLSKYEKNVAAQFELPYVYNAGSHLGCGCGFLKDFEDEEELAQSNKNYLQLSAYLQKGLETEATIQIYSCWDGDQETRPLFREKMDLKHLVESNFEFKEKAFYEIL